MSTIYVGAVVGAGFATGQEIMHFFTRFGLPGYWGIGLATFLFAWLGYQSVVFVFDHGITHYRAFLEEIMGSRLGAVVDGGIILFLFLEVGIILSATAALAAEQWQVPFRLGVLASTLFCTVVFLFGTSVILSVNSLLVAVLVASTGAILWMYTRSGVVIPADGVGVGAFWLESALLYVSYNWIVAVTCFASVVKDLEDKRAGARYAAVGGLLLGAGIFAVNTILWRHAPEVFRYQIPFAFAAADLGSFWRVLYSFGLLSALLTTVLAMLITLRARLASRSLTLAILLASVPITNLGFANLVKSVYVAYGSVGFIVLLFFCWKLFPRFRTMR